MSGMVALGLVVVVALAVTAMAVAVLAVDAWIGGDSPEAEAGDDGAASTRRMRSGHPKAHAPGAQWAPEGAPKKTEAPTLARQGF